MPVRAVRRDGRGAGGGGGGRRGGGARAARRDGEQRRRAAPDGARRGHGPRGSGPGDVGELPRRGGVREARGARHGVARHPRRHRVHGERGVVPGRFGPAAYTASKHAVLGLVRAAAGELGRHGVRVNCVSPGGVATPLSCGLTGMSPEEMEAAAEPHNVLRGKVLKAADVAEAMLFLASDQAAFVSGHNLVVDGATTAVNYAVLQSVGL